MTNYNTVLSGILPKQFVGIGAVLDAYWYLGTYDNVPFTMEELDNLDSGSFLVAMPQINLRQLFALFATKFVGHEWVSDESFSQTLTRPGYHIVKPLRESLGKKWQNQLAVLPNDSVVLTAVEAVYISLSNAGEGLPYLRAMQDNGDTAIVYRRDDGRVCIIRDSGMDLNGQVILSSIYRPLED